MSAARGGGHAYVHLDDKEGGMEGSEGLRVPSPQVEGQSMVLESSGTLPRIQKQWPMVNLSNVCALCL